MSYLGLFRSHRTGPTSETDHFLCGVIYGPPPYKRINCVLCQQSKAIPWQKGCRLYCDDCQEIPRKIRGAVQAKVFKAVQKGLLQHPSKLSCADCGRQAAAYDHRDYSQPLKVDPVCKRCNKLRGPANWKAA